MYSRACYDDDMFYKLYTYPNTKQTSNGEIHLFNSTEIIFFFDPTEYADFPSTLKIVANKIIEWLRPTTVTSVGELVASEEDEADEPSDDAFVRLHVGLFEAMHGSVMHDPIRTYLSKLETALSIMLESYYLEHKKQDFTRQQLQNGNFSSSNLRKIFRYFNFRIIPVVHGVRFYYWRPCGSSRLGSRS